MTRGGGVGKEKNSAAKGKESGYEGSRKNNRRELSRLNSWLDSRGVGGIYKLRNSDRTHFVRVFDDICRVARATAPRQAPLRERRGLCAKWKLSFRRESSGPIDSRWPSMLLSIFCDSSEYRTAWYRGPPKRAWNRSGCACGCTRVCCLPKKKLRFNRSRVLVDHFFFFFLTETVLWNLSSYEILR